MACAIHGKYDFLDQFIELKPFSHHRYNPDHVALRRGSDQTFTDARTQ
ncbi:Unknown protein sequence [Pseudomonas syringae pv. cilantro]|uniref:Uncharacterized protein n=2 Tax=Pseudomonas syringae group TaxID=136849 RepID=A0A0N0GFX8_PSESX|nr:Unknown protein sequence [Pseudomonas syringae pv. cilantro]KPW71823.1 hypothetical protein ALO76_102590 [Pseudomonas syringae pv. coriandricola]RMN12707.1 hypothetical protein ALQ65_102419 [Pseudomonas syringae pv. coriandricola]RMO74741.1 hypothetical protein ALQ34_103921 [Pseudomonas syringae pv. maculicola]